MNYNQFLSNTVKGLPPSAIRRFFSIVAEKKDVITLGIGEPDFTTPWHIKEACIDGLKRGQTSYTDNSGLAELRQEICRYVKRKWQVEYNYSTEAIVTVGVSEALDIIMRSIINNGDEVIIVEPCFVAYHGCIALAGGKAKVVCARPGNDFMVTCDDILPAITERTKAIVIGYPANPTGAIMSRDEMLKIANLAEEHNLLVVADEIYAELTYDHEHCCFAGLPAMKKRTILLNGLSKSHAMTGWRLGYALGPEPLISAMTKIHQYTIMSAPTTAQIAAVEALANGEEAMQQMVCEYNSRRIMVLEMIKQIGLTCVEPKGAFYVFPSIQLTGFSSIEFCERLLTEENVAVVPGTAFGNCGEGYIRCCYAASRENLQEAFERIGEFVIRHSRH